MGRGSDRAAPRLRTNGCAEPQGALDHSSARSVLWEGPASTQTFGYRRRSGICLPALSLLPGHTPAQAAACCALQNTGMSVPSSDDRGHEGAAPGDFSESSMRASSLRRLKTPKTSDVLTPSPVVPESAGKASWKPRA